MRPSKDIVTGGDEAIVVGGSVAGLLAGCVLADHFTHVTIIDRDTAPREPAFRKGAPQAHHIHVLLARGFDILRQLFPGIAEELVAAGARPLQWPTDALWLGPRGWVPRFEPGINAISCGRELLEWIIRQRVDALPNVRLVEGTDVAGLITSSDNRNVKGVRLRIRPSATGGASPPEHMHADLVVDASGRHSKTPGWLEELGYTPPRIERIDALLGYASRDYAIPPEFSGDWKSIYLQAKPPKSTRSGALFQITPHRWRMGLLGAGRDYPPTDEDGFMEFARTLRSPLIHEVISGAEPLTPIRGYQQTANVRRYYEKVRRLPGRFLVTGDAATTFNPIYGQGMTAAAQSAMVLDRVLREEPARLDDIGSRFHRAAAKANASAWVIATGEDLRYPTTEGGSRTLQTRLTHRYLDRVFRGTMERRSALFAFLDVIQLVDSPPALAKPTILLPSLLYGGYSDRDAPASDLGMPAPAVPPGDQ